MNVLDERGNTDLGAVFPSLATCSLRIARPASTWLQALRFRRCPLQCASSSGVTDRAEGARRVYAVNPEALASLRKYFEQFWSQALAAFKRHVEAGANKKIKKR
jgi:hypothetical protein